MHPFPCFRIVVDICSVFLDLQDKPDIYELFYQCLPCLFEIRVFQDFLRRVQEDRREGGLLPFPAVPFVARL